MSAAIRGHEDVIKLLLDAVKEQGQAVHTKDYVNQKYENRMRSGWTALWFAAMGGHKGTIEILCEAEADVNIACDDGFSPLMAAAFNGQDEVVELLGAKRADVAVRLKSGLGLVGIAALRGFKQTVKILCDLRADPGVRHHATGFSAPFLAVLGGHGSSRAAGVLEQLLRLGVDVHSPTAGGVTPLDLARAHKLHRLAEIEQLLDPSVRCAGSSVETVSGPSRCCQRPEPEPVVT